MEDRVLHADLLAPAVREVIKHKFAFPFLQDIVSSQLDYLAKAFRGEL